MILRPPHRQIYKERPRDFDVRTRRLAERWKREKAERFRQILDADPILSLHEDLPLGQPIELWRKNQ